MKAHQLHDFSDQELRQAIDECAKEPIHIPGSIQPHGYLIVVDDDLVIRNVSENCVALFQRPLDLLIASDLSTLLDEQDIQTLLSRRNEGELNPLRATMIEVAGMPCDCIAHRANGVTVIELEPDETPRTATPAAVTEDFYQELMQFSINIQRISDQQLLFDHVVNVIRRVTGFSRVMLYQFDEEWNGQVVAEARSAHMSTYLGLRFPQTDIPSQARALYAKNYLRIIQDVEYTPCAIVPHANTQEGKPIDLSFSVLRSVSPVHIQYLHNMGVKATMSISILQNDNLWGLIACHNDQPIHVPYRTRMLAELLGHSFSALLSSLNKAAEDHQRASRTALVGGLSSIFNREDNLLDSIRKKSDLLLDAVDADGVIVSLHGKYFAFGLIPEVSFTQDLITWLEDNHQDRVFHTNAIGRAIGRAVKGQAMASGVLAIPVSREMTNYILWFRQEKPEQVAWAGQPVKKIQRRGNNYHLSPRNSFTAWVQNVRGVSRPWTDDDVRTGQRIAKMILTKSYEDSLRQKNVDLTTILNHSGSPAFLIDINGDVLSINEQAIEHLGVSSHAPVGKAFSSIVSTEIYDLFSYSIDDVAASQLPTSVEIELPIQDERRHFLCSVFPLFDINYDVYAVCVFSNDVSRLRQVEIELMKSNKELERMAFVASHDLKEPLRSVRSFSEYLDKNYEHNFDAQGKKMLQIISRSAERMSTLIDDLLGYTRLIDDDFMSHTVSTEELLQNLLEPLRSDPDLDAVFEHKGAFPLIRMKETHFTSIMQNLVQNALKYRAKDRKPHIVTSYRKEQGYHVFGVEDNGIGIEEEYLSDVFDLFKRLHTQSEYEGTGIGLALCRRIVESYGGTIGVRSTPGVGSTFTFRIPA